MILRRGPDVSAETGGVAVGGSVVNSTITIGPDGEALAAAIDALPEAIQRVVATAVDGLRRDVGAKDRLILAFIRAATAREVASDQIEATLFEMAGEWRAARPQAAGAMANLTPDLSALRAQADAAYAAEEVERFWTLLIEIERREQAAYDALAARRSEIEAEQAAVREGLIATKRRAVATAVARLDAEGAASRLAEIVALETPDPAARFAALRAVWLEWWERGRDRGLNFDLAVSVWLARARLVETGDAGQRWAALNNLGISLTLLGEREAATALLEQAVAAHAAALEERARERFPLDWAGTQNNLGNALRALGELETGNGRLEQAVAAIAVALEECTRARVPLDWAMTQNNLGVALQRLGAREAGTARLEHAMAAFCAALEEFTRELVPVDWAMTQNNLGTALATLGSREVGTTRLAQAVAAFSAALEERTRAAYPRANSLENLGNALRALAEREGAAGRAGEAVAALHEALAIYREAGADYDIGRCEKALAEARALHARLSA